jgi:hypothetical protein
VQRALPQQKGKARKSQVWRFAKLTKKVRESKTSFSPSFRIPNTTQQVTAVAYPTILSSVNEEKREKARALFVVSHKGAKMKNRLESIPISANAAAQRALRQLIRDIKGAELEAGRNLAYEEVRTLLLDPPVIDRILRRVGEARSTAGLVAGLEAFVAALDHQPRSRLKAWLTAARRWVRVLRSYLRFSSRA